MLVVASLGLMAMTTIPTSYGFTAIGINAAVLVALRFFSKREGRKEANV